MRNQWVFWLHYNRPATEAAGEVRWSVHFRGRCHVVRSVRVEVPLASRARRDQPRAVLVGRASRLEVVDGEAVLQ